MKKTILLSMTNALDEIGCDRATLIFDDLNFILVNN
jgi:hypothetical protein